MAILNNSNAISSGGYDINNSLRFRSSASAYLSRTPATAGNRRTFTYSAWVKIGTIGIWKKMFSVWNANTDAGYFDFGINNNNTFTIQGWNTAWRITTQVFRDPSAWYHIVVAVDTTQATAANRIKLYVNGNQVTSFSSSSDPTQNYDFLLNSTVATYIGTDASAVGTSNFDGYQTDINFIDGSQKAASDFGETDTTTGVWKPKAYTGTYGTNGFCLKFYDIATTSGSNAGLGKDFSGNANYFNTNNISVTAGTTYDAMIDSPTLTSATVGNYCTLNPLPYYGGYNVLSRGNLQFTSGNTNWMRAFATIAVSSGKWYWEVTANHTESQMHGISNVTNLSYSAGAQNWVGFDATGYAYFTDGTKYNSNSGVAYGATYGAGDIIGIAFDADNGKLFFSKNGTFQASGDPAAGTNAAFTGLTSGPYVPAVSVSTFSGANTCDANFGQRPFSYTPPTGYVRLNTYNLPDSTIVKGNTVMDATTYTGNGTTNTITNASGFKPDFLWTKSRSNGGGGYNNIIFDSVRGASKSLATDLAGTEYTGTDLTSFNSNGFTAAAPNQWFGVNNSGVTFVAWQWQAGQGTSTSNTSGSITSTVSVNTTAGFSIVTYTGTGANATVGHGLGVAPKFIIVKGRNATGAYNWMVYTAALGNTYYAYMNLTNAFENFSSTIWNNTSPTSTTFSIGNNVNVNASGGTYVAYCWAEIAGFSKFGSYTGNGSADGTFVFTGFRPKFILIKSTGVESWSIVDTSRSLYNQEDASLFPNLSNAEGTGNTVSDILSNGFKLRNTWAGSNTNAQTYIYMAFAENPFKNANAR